MGLEGDIVEGAGFVVAVTAMLERMDDCKEMRLFLFSRWVFLAKDVIVLN